MKLRNIIFFLLVFCIAACSKDFLERQQAGTLPEDVAITSEADLQKLLNGAYFMLSSDYRVPGRDAEIKGLYGGRIQYISDLMADQANGSLYSGDDGEFFNRRTSIFGGYKNEYYTGVYYIINEANKALERLDLATTNKDNIEGQAKFLRAIAHFELVRMYAQPFGSTTANTHLGIPLRLRTSKEAINRSTVKEVYDAIIADLQIAENKLQDNSTTGIPSRWAAKAFLAKVYFQQNNFVQAFNYADQVIKSNKFSLDANFTHRFNLGRSTEGIFVLKNVQNNLSPGGELRNRYRSDVGFSAQGKFHMTDIFYNLATSAGDIRGLAWYSKNAQGFNVLKKYDRDFFDMPIVHLTEILLIRAEAGAETGISANLTTAISDINTILTRAFNGNSQNIPLTSAAGTVISSVRLQRELEMVGEGNRLQEIKRIGVRNNINIDRRGAPWNCNGLVLQFPNGEQASNTTFVMNPEGGCN
jgi:starch-binding outer membrane protein, SusD/RagB family